MDVLVASRRTSKNTTTVTGAIPRSRVTRRLMYRGSHFLVKRASLIVGGPGTAVGCSRPRWRRDCEFASHRCRAAEATDARHRSVLISELVWKSERILRLTLQSCISSDYPCYLYR